MANARACADGYYELAKPQPLSVLRRQGEFYARRGYCDDTRSDEAIKLAAESFASDFLGAAPAACLCNKRFKQTTMTSLWHAWMQNAHLNFEGERAIAPEAWAKAGIERPCCRKTIMTHLPIDTLHTVYTEANRVHPADWCFENYVVIDNDKMEPTRHATTATRQFYEDMVFDEEEEEEEADD